MTLNGRNVPLAEIKSSYEAHHENFNEDRSTPLAATCKKCKAYADMRGGSNGEDITISQIYLRPDCIT